MDDSRTRKNRTVRRTLISTLALVIGSGITFQSFAQTPSASPTAQVVSLVGEVKAIDATAKQIVLRADSGVISTVNLSEKTQYKRLAPGETTLAKATDITLADVGPGDRVLARWRSGVDIKTAATPQVVIRKKPVLVKKQQQDRAQGSRGGVNGLFASFNLSPKEFP